MKIVKFSRCSTKKQSDKHSLESQDMALQDYVDKNDVEVVGDFVEVGSGRRVNRPIVDAAIATCKRENATLVVARLDRISRRASMLNTLIESNIEFLALDFPNADKLTLGIMAQMAAYESRLISDRTRAAIKVRKAQGVKWGNYGRELAQVNKDAAKVFADTIREEIRKAIDSTRVPTFKRISDKLNAAKVKTRQGKKFYPATVRRVMGRLEMSL